MSYFDDNEDLITGVNHSRNIQRPLSSKEITDDNFYWKTKDTDQFLKPEEMETRHLFFTLRMIYNNSVPDKYRHDPVRLYQFGSFYTTEYFSMAVRVISKELSRRTDLTPYFKRSLEFMRRGIEMMSKTKIEDNYGKD